MVAAQEEIWRRTFNISCSNMNRSILGLRYVDNRLWLSESRFEQLPGIRLLLNNHFYGGSIVLEEEPAYEFVGSPSTSRNAEYFTAGHAKHMTFPAYIPPLLNPFF